MREKAKVVLVLMEDDEKLKEERESALKTRDKISKNATGERYRAPPTFERLQLTISLKTFLENPHRTQN